MINPEIPTKFNLFITELNDLKNPSLQCANKIYELSKLNPLSLKPNRLLIAVHDVMNGISVDECQKQTISDTERAIDICKDFINSTIAELNKYRTDYDRDIFNIGLKLKNTLHSLGLAIVTDEFSILTFFPNLIVDQGDMVLAIRNLQQKVYSQYEDIGKHQSYLQAITEAKVAIDSLSKVSSLANRFFSTSLTPNLKDEESEAGFKLPVQLREKIAQPRTMLLLASYQQLIVISKGMLELYSMEKGKLERKSEIKNIYTQFALMKNGKLIIAIENPVPFGKDSFQVWDVEKWYCECEIQLKNGGSVTKISSSVDEIYFHTNKNIVEIYDISSFKMKEEIHAEAGYLSNFVIRKDFYFNFSLYTLLIVDRNTNKNQLTDQKKSINARTFSQQPMMKDVVVMQENPNPEILVLFSQGNFSVKKQVKEYFYQKHYKFDFKYKDYLILSNKKIAFYSDDTIKIMDFNDEPKQIKEISPDNGRIIRLALDDSENLVCIAEKEIQYLTTATSSSNKNRKNSENNNDNDNSNDDNGNDKTSNDEAENSSIFLGG